MAAVPGLGYGRSMLLTQTSTLLTTVLPLGEAVGFGTQIAMLPSPPAAGLRSVQLQVDSTKELKPFIQNGSTLSATINYSPTPITARSLQLTLTIHGSLF